MRSSTLTVAFILALKMMVPEHEVQAAPAAGEREESISEKDQNNTEYLTTTNENDINEYQSKEHDSKAHDSKQDHSKDHDSKAHDSKQDHSKDHDSKAHDSKQDHSKDHDSKAHDSKQDHSKDHDSKAHDSKQDHSKDHDSKAHDRKQDHSKDHESKAHDSKQDHSKDHDSKAHDSKQDHSKDHDSKAHDSKQDHSKDHDSKAHDSKQDHNKDHDSKAHDSKQDHSKDHDSKAHDSKQNHSKDHDSKSHDSKQDHSKDHDSKAHDSKQDHSKDHDSKAHDSKQDHSKDHDSKAHDSKHDHSKDHDSKAHDNKQDHSKDHDSKAHDSKHDHSKDHDSKAHDNKQDHSKDHDSKAHDSKQDHSKDHNSKGHDSKQDHSKDYSSKGHDSKQDHSKDHSSKGHDSKQDHSKDHSSKGHDSKQDHSKHHSSKGHDSKQDHSKDHSSKGHDSKQDHSKDHSSKGHDSKQDHSSKGNDSKQDHSSKGHDSKQDHSSKGHDSKQDHSKGHSNKEDITTLAAPTSHNSNEDVTTVHPSKQKNIILQYILNFLISEGNSVTGIFFFDGYYVPIEFVLTVLNIKGDSIDSTTPQKLLQIIYLYNENLQNFPSEEEPSFIITEEEIITLKYIINYLQTDDSTTTGNIVFNGQLIPVKYIFNVLNHEDKDLDEISVEDLYVIIMTYIKTETTTITIADHLGDEPTNDQLLLLNSILQFLKTQGNDVSVVFTFHGYKIPSQVITIYMVEHGKNIQNITTEDLWKIILEYVACAEHTTGEVESSTPHNTKSGESSSFGQDTSLIKSTSSSYPDSTTELVSQTTGRSTTNKPTTTAQAIVTSTQSAQNDPLQNFILIWKTEGDKADGTIEINGNEIPTQFMLSVLTLENISPQNVTLDNLNDIALLYIKYAEITTTVGIDVPKDQAITLQYILQILNSKSQGDTGFLVFKGHHIPINYIFNISNIEHINMSQLTVPELYHILEVYIGNEDPNTEQTIPSEDIPILEQIQLVIKTQGDNVNGNVEINGQNISLKTVINILNLQNIDLSDVTVQDLWRVFQLLILIQSNNSTTGGTDSQKQDIYQNFLKIISDPEKVPNSYLVINGISVPVQDIINALHLQINSTTGKYDTQNLTPDNLYQILLTYLNNSSNTDEKKVMLNSFLNVMSDPHKVANSFLLYNGHNISMQDILNALHLKMNSTTGKYDTQGVTEDLLFNVIQQLQNNQESTTLPAQTTKETSVFLESFLNVISNPQNIGNAVIMYNGQNIPAWDIVSALDLQVDSSTGKYDTQNLTEDELLQTIQKIANSMATSTVAN